MDIPDYTKSLVIKAFFWL